MLIKRHFVFLPAFGLPSYTCRIWEVALAYVINAILMSETDILTSWRKWPIGFKQGIIAVVVEGDPIHRTKDYHRLKRVFCFLTFTFLVVSKIPCDCQRILREMMDRVWWHSVVSFTLQRLCSKDLRKNFWGAWRNKTALIKAFIYLK